MRTNPKTRDAEADEDEAKEGERQLTEVEQEDADKQRYKDMNNDSNWKIIGNVCNVLSIFQYTICIFYAQLVLTSQIQANE